MGAATDPGAPAAGSAAPRPRATAPGSPTPARPRGGSSSAPAGAGPGRGEADPVVLVVEDDPHLAGLLQRALAHHHLEVLVAGTGDEALRWLREVPDVDALVLDVMIPHPDGIEVCRKARRDGHRGPIVVISARGGDAHRDRALAAGADVFLAKPFPLVDLGATVVDLVGGGGAAAGH